MNYSCHLWNHVQLCNELARLKHVPGKTLSSGGHEYTPKSVIFSLMKPSTPDPVWFGDNLWAIHEQFTHLFYQTKSIKSWKICFQTNNTLFFFKWILTFLKVNKSGSRLFSVWNWFPIKQILSSAKKNMISCSFICKKEIIRRALPECIHLYVGVMKTYGVSTDICWSESES